MRVSAYISAALGLSILVAPRAHAGDALSFADPKGDDDGWGKAEYPTGKEYTPGCFDMVGLSIREDGADTVFEVQLAAELTDPWKSKEWNGNGFSVQFVQVYLDTDGKKRSGEKKTVPGAWVDLAPDGYYEKVVLISPQPRAKLLGEIEGKARWLKARVIVPSRTEARGKTLVARVPTSELGGAPSSKWGVQALMLSNEGFPAPEDVLARRVNELPGEHRFGGGCDGLGDPQVIDLLAGAAKGEPGEAQAQHELLSRYKCADSAKDAQLAVVPMIHR